MNTTAAQLVRANAERFKQYLEIEHPFRLRDLDKHHREVDIDRLVDLGIAEIVGQEEVQRQSERAADSCEINRYRWRTEYLSLLQDEVAENDECLPCGHKGHILNKRDGNYGCRYCSEDRDFERETVMEAL
jgi:hypothetical protein